MTLLASFVVVALAWATQPCAGFPAIAVPPQFEQFAPAWVGTLHELGAPVCTVSLIAPTIALTAAHCTLGPGNTPTRPNASLFSVSFGPSNDHIGIMHITFDVDADFGRAFRDHSILHLSGAWPHYTGPFPSLAAQPPMFLPKRLFVAGVGWRPHMYNFTWPALMGPAATNGDWNSNATHAKLCSAIGTLCAAGPTINCPGDSGGPLFDPVSLIIYATVSQGELGQACLYRVPDDPPDIYSNLWAGLPSV